MFRFRIDACGWVLLLVACGPPDEGCSAVAAASERGATLTAQGQTFRYGGFRSSRNNDCTVIPSVVSLHLEGHQVEPAASEEEALAFCLPRPDKIGAAPIQLGDASMIQLVAASARSADGCELYLDFTAPLTGTATFQGFCDEPGHIYNVTLAGTAGGTKRCQVDGGAGTTTSVVLRLAGTVAVEAL
jgi:hypothetical protein